MIWTHCSVAVLLGGGSRKKRKRWRKAPSRESDALCMLGRKEERKEEVVGGKGRKAEGE
jgi:hypothetical protein